MEKLFITPKRKSSYRSDSEPSPEDKRFKESNSPAKISGDEDGVMEVLGNKIDLEWVHRMGKPRKENGRERIIIARFLRFSDREQVLQCTRKLKDKGYKMYEDLPKEIHEMRKLQMEKSKNAREDGKRAYFSRSEPDKLCINGKYVKM